MGTLARLPLVSALIPRAVVRQHERRGGVSRRGFWRSIDAVRGSRVGMLRCESTKPPPPLKAKEKALDQDTDVTGEKGRPGHRTKLTLTTPATDAAHLHANWRSYHAQAK